MASIAALFAIIVDWAAFCSTFVPVVILIMTPGCQPIMLVLSWYQVPRIVRIRSKGILVLNIKVHLYIG